MTKYRFDQELSRRVAAEVEDIDQLAGLFFEAAETERKLPRTHNLQVKTSWPDVLPSVQLAYGYHELTVRPPPATSREVTRFDVAADILREIGPDDARLIWAVSVSAVRRARGPHWARLGKIMGLHPATVKRRFSRALMAVWYKMAYAD